MHHVVPDVPDDQLEPLQALARVSAIKNIVDHKAAFLLCARWQTLATEARRLSDVSLHNILKNFATSSLQVLCSSLSAALRWGSEEAAIRSQTYADRLATAKAPSMRKRLKICLGSPGVTGCSNVAGTSIAWNIFTDAKTGILTAMRTLSLDIIVLPGARLPSTFTPPPKWRLSALCRWGTKYNSCAILWNSDLDGVAAIPDIGGDRRVHLFVPRANGSGPLIVLGIYLHTGSTKEVEEMWHAELIGLENDIVTLRTRFAGSGKVDFLILGDFNIQPEALGAGPDPFPSRDKALQGLLDRQELHLINPCLSHDAVQDVCLPLRDKIVKIRPGDTHHHVAGGRSRAIDLGICSSSAAATFTIHNSLNCSTEQHKCPWELCLEFTRGDHFLAQADIDDVFDVESCASAMRMPMWLHEKSSWISAWSAASKVTAHACKQLFEVLADQTSLAQCRQVGPFAARWLADATAWNHAMCAALALDGWVVKPSVSASSSSQSLKVEKDMDHPWLSHLRKACSDGSAPSSLLSSCLKLMKSPEPNPPSRMLKGDRLLSQEETHIEWCKFVTDQTKWPNPFDLEYDVHVNSTARQSKSRSWSKRGVGNWDFDVSEGEYMCIVCDWKPSDATTPDLIPRIAFKVENKGWDTYTWLCVRLAGPGILALRPMLWRETCMVPRHKRGPLFLFDSWRLLEIRAQVGLVQECILTHRVRSTLHANIIPGQSGYIRDASDAHLLLHEIIALRHDTGLPTIPLLGDVARAFPRTWREDFFNEICISAKLTHGAQALFGDTLDSDVVIVTIQGFSKVMKVVGVPEGGVWGPTGFPAWFNSLTVYLRNRGHGVGIMPPLPRAWNKCIWPTHGVPSPQWTKWFSHALASQGQLPTVEQLQGDANLAASALRALDLCAACRIALVLQADDPAILASSHGALQDTLTDIAGWAFLHKVAFHVGSNKSVLLTRRDVNPPELVFPTVGLPASPICAKLSHKYLGILWPGDLVFTPALLQCICVASCLVATIAGLVQSASLPLCFASALFEAKVEGYLRYSRWLLAIAPGAAQVFNDAYDSWARQLLGSQPWRSAAVARGELGWVVSGMLQAVVDVAMRRARLWSLPVGDFYRTVFTLGGAAHAPTTWYSLSKSLLLEYNVPDIVDLGCPLLPLSQYKKLVKDTLSASGVAKWQLDTAAHSIPFPIQLLHSGPSADCAVLRRCSVSWDTLSGQRSLCRLRAGLLDLSHRNNRRSNASQRYCIFCGVLTRAPYIHVLGECSFTAQHRSALEVYVPATAPREASLNLLCATASQAYFALAVSFASYVEKASCNFWKTKLLTDV